MQKENLTQALLQKFILNQCDKNETESVIAYIQKINDSSDLPSVEDVLALLEEKPVLSELDANRIHNTILKLANQKQKETSRKRSRIWRYVAASVFIGVLFSGYFFKNYFFGNPSDQLIIDTKNITLQLENGTIKVIKEDGSTEVVDAAGNIVGTQKGNLLIYNKEDAAQKTLTYNTLTVPYGRRFELQLSDGTSIHLNAGTSLKYPVNFIEGKNRQVFLEGEGFFKVAKDAKHPFIVNSNDMDVRVLGTQFNISSYPEDEQINTVLVEGLVSVYGENEVYNSKTAVKLNPGFKAAWQKNNKQIAVSKVDTEMFTDWINGKIIFRHLPFKNIIKKLERHYNVDIVCNNKRLNNELFTASFEKETIEQVLTTFNKNYAINYTIKDNKIIISESQELP
ncbi:FecR family protein [Flavobacterium sp. LS1P28]|uniref:FecR family protein n=1 Tax=Flavobacterium sp. LS1P28 TaxID=2497752 RepID=UPI000F834C1C|nr:FecR family protein [Flavobacterium sp. LS1P28]RTY77515.1 FecR family protein [Flavobacterium sp. LS1P28]